MSAQPASPPVAPPQSPPQPPGVTLKDDQAALREALLRTTEKTIAGQDPAACREYAQAVLYLAQSLALIDPSIKPAASQPGSQTPVHPGLPPAPGASPGPAGSQRPGAPSAS